MAASTRSKTRRLAPKPGPPYLAPELLLNIFLNVSDRKTQLALRSTCKQFRDIMDRQIFPSASCTVGRHLTGRSAGSLCGITHVTCAPHQIAHLAQASTRITSVTLPVHQWPLAADESTMARLSKWPALAKLGCGLGYRHFVTYPPGAFAALRELDLGIHELNKSYSELFKGMHCLETLKITDQTSPDDWLEGRVWSGIREGDRDIIKFYTSLWAALAQLPRLASLHLRIILEPDHGLAWEADAILHAPEGSFLSLRRVCLEVEQKNNWEGEFLDEDGEPIEVNPAIWPWEATEFVKQFPLLEHLSITGCDTWPFAMHGPPWEQLKTFKFQRTKPCLPFSPVFPASMKRMTGLQTIAINNTSLEDLPEWLGELTELAELQLEDTGVAALPPSITELRGLTSINLKGSVKFVELPDDIGWLTSLVELNLRGCRALASLPPSMSALTRLTRLDLSRVEKRPVADIGHILPLSLRHLDLSYRRMRQLPVSLTRLTGLEHLDIGHNHIMRLPSWIDNLRELQRLEMAHISILEVPRCLGRLSKLTYLDMSDMFGVLPGSNPASVGRLQLISRPARRPTMGLGRRGKAIYAVN